MLKSQKNYRSIMKQTDIKKEIEALKLNTAIITDFQTKDIFNTLLNLIERLYSENEQFKEANQILLLQCCLLWLMK